ncbi:hypothetical protein BC830DRAFT_1220069 [Chytriomyces sp. MP71]|nr:hypothetical protein BC830DRAFT_1220069 [Chytriomyces sp. MP71]
MHNTYLMAPNVAHMKPSKRFSLTGCMEAMMPFNTLNSRNKQLRPTPSCTRLTTYYFTVIIIAFYITTCHIFEWRCRTPLFADNQQRKPPTHNLLQVANAESARLAKTNRINLRLLNVSNSHTQSGDGGCPPEQPALIGILTVPSLETTARRNHLRSLYARINAGLPKESQIDFKWVMGKSTNEFAALQLQMEQDMYPEDTIVTSRKEGRDEGKILDWIREARNLTFVPHPTRSGQWCQKYSYIGKADDDAVIHLERLVDLIDSLPVGSTNYVGRQSFPGTRGRHMTGMLYMLTPDLIEWMSHSPIAATKLFGIEDVVISDWMWHSGINITWIDVQDSFHNLPHSTYFQKRISNESVVVHMCKNTEEFFGCVENLYEPQLTIIGPDHELLEIEAMGDRILNQFGVNITTEDGEEVKQRMTTRLVNQATLSEKEYDTIILESIMTPIFSKERLAEVSDTEKRDVIDKIRESAQNKWLGPNEVELLVLRHVMEKRLERLGYPGIMKGTQETVKQVMKFLTFDYEQQALDSMLLREILKDWVLRTHLKVDENLVDGVIKRLLLSLAANEEAGDARLTNDEDIYSSVKDALNTLYSDPKKYNKVV